MGELIRIGAKEGSEESEGLGATVSTNGAWIIDLSLGDQPILFPKGLLHDTDGTERIRGGMHPCSPWFGPVKEPAHGFARNSEWELDDVSENHAQLSLRGRFEGYERLHQKIGYFVGSNSLLTLLEITNHGEDTADIAPGFHPYLYKPTGFRDLENGQPRQRDNVSLDLYGSSLTEVELLSGYKVFLMARGLTHIIEWTDRLGDEDYVCVEPTASGATLDARQRGVISLSHGESALFSLDMSILRPSV